MTQLVTIKVEGLRDLKLALDQLPLATGLDVLHRVLAKAAEPIRAEAEALAPARPADAPPKYYGGTMTQVGGRRVRVGGKLRKPGTDRALWLSGTRLTKRQARQVRKEGKSFAEHYVGTRDPIARLLEFGTRDHAATPMLRPAWDNNKGKALDIIGRELGAEIDQAAQRLGRGAR